MAFIGFSFGHELKDKCVLGEIEKLTNFLFSLEFLICCVHFVLRQGWVGGSQWPAGSFVKSGNEGVRRLER